uniref:(northern house mosquito) hypothetical protein n=2 Tax=Culex pipiens TaxID=7175 RepID=A0A8D8CE55_CULPI
MLAGRCPVSLLGRHLSVRAQRTRRSPGYGIACQVMSLITPVSSVAHPPTLPHLTGGSLGSCQSVSAARAALSLASSRADRLPRRPRSTKSKTSQASKGQRPQEFTDDLRIERQNSPGGVSCSSLRTLHTPTTSSFVRGTPPTQPPTPTSEIHPHDAHPRPHQHRRSPHRRAAHRRTTHPQRNIFMACGPSINVTWLGKLFRFLHFSLHALHRISPEETCNKNNINKMTYTRRRRRRHQPMQLHTVCTLWSTIGPTRSRACSAGASPPTHTEEAQREAAPEAQHGSRSWHTATGLANADDRSRGCNGSKTHHHVRYSAATPTRRLHQGSTEAADDRSREQNAVQQAENAPSSSSTMHPTKSAAT